MGSFDSKGRRLIGSSELSRLLAERAGFEYNNEILRKTVGAARTKIGDDGINSILQERFRNCSPCDFYKTLAKYPWRRIYTLNIDDSFEAALRQYSPQDLVIHYRNDPVEDFDPTYKRLDFIKLNGCATRLHDGVIFSEKDYAKGASKPPAWYRELGSDFFKYPFLFLATRLDEPLFYQQVERFRGQSNSIEPMSWMITRGATEIEKADLEESKIYHLSADLDDFAHALRDQIAQPPKITNIAIAEKPELAALLEEVKSEAHERFIAALNHVVKVSRLDLSATSGQEGAIRDFYRGFKPDWRDIIDEVPAKLSHLREFISIFDDVPRLRRLVILYGPAGSGKTTTLMQTALHLNERDKINSYFLEEPVDNLEEVVACLDKANHGRYFLFSDSADLLSDQIIEIIERQPSGKCVFVFSERENIWNSRLKLKLDPYVGESMLIGLIAKSDAKAILEKVQRYGPWTRLAQMTEGQRVHELFERSRRQLLIGLLETTSGDGFEAIIERDFSRIGDAEERNLVLLAGLATIHRQRLSSALTGRAFGNLGIGKNPLVVAASLSGIVKNNGKGYQVRHPIYVRQLFMKTVPGEDLFDIVVALLEAFAGYGAPVIRHVDKRDGAIFKGVINHKFLKEIFRGSDELTLGVYKRFETVFSIDGLFWLQYGLALRGFDRHPEALSILRTAVDAYRMVHTEHALAQQMLIQAFITQSREEALQFLQEAMDILLHLDRVLERDDIYPIVTLSEGHSRVASKHFALREAQEIATQYYEKIRHRFRGRQVPERLRETQNNLARFVTTGDWPGGTSWWEGLADL